MFLHLNKLESPSPGLLYVKFGWNEPSGSGKEDFPLEKAWFFILPSLVEICLVGLEKEIFKILSMYFRCVVIISHKKRAWPLICSSPKDALCKVWLKLDMWFWRRRWECVQFTDRQTTCDQKSSLELSPLVSWKRQNNTNKIQKFL